MQWSTRVALQIRIQLLFFSNLKLSLSIEIYLTFIFTTKHYIGTDLRVSFQISFSIERLSNSRINCIKIEKCQLICRTDKLIEIHFGFQSDDSRPYRIRTYISRCNLSEILYMDRNGPAKMSWKPGSPWINSILDRIWHLDYLINPLKLQSFLFPNCPLSFASKIGPV